MDNAEEEYGRHACNERRRRRQSREAVSALFGGFPGSSLVPILAGR
jgi:hypothetical protein